MTTGMTSNRQAGANASALSASTTSLRRSPLQSAITPHHPQWVIIDGMSTAFQFDTKDAERMAALGIADLSFMFRCGLKGPHSVAWLTAQGLPIPQINSWEPLPGGGIIARLGVTEFLIEDSAGDSTAKQLADALKTRPDGVYPVLRQDASFAVTGAFLQTLLRQTCAMNFNVLDLSTRPLALTSMVGVQVLVIPSELNEQPLYRVWFDGTYADYLWQTLLGIAGEHGGGPVGLDCLMQKNAMQQNTRQHNSHHLIPQRSAR
ncbi:hypothetical protein C7W93_18025 [Glaciimonas sp. PCH181]|nr:hypothetical protein C7W93_18025 [Glaciimonas sp. PCH181]